MLRMSLIALVCALACLGCPSACQDEGLTGPTDLSAGGGTMAATPIRAIPEWSSYLGVHGFAPHLNVQQPYLEALFRSGAVQGIRLDMDPHGGPAFATFAAG